MISVGRNNTDGMGSRRSSNSSGAMEGTGTFSFSGSLSSASASAAATSNATNNGASGTAELEGILWDEVTAVFGVGAVDRGGDIEALKCLHVKDHGTLFVTANYLFFVPEESDFHLGVLEHRHNSQPRSGWHSSARSSIDTHSNHHLSTPTTSSDALPQRRLSMFRNSGGATYLPPEPFSIPVASIMSIQKTRTSPVLLQQNAIHLECRNTSDDVFSHTAKHTFSGFTIKLAAVEKKLVDAVGAWKEAHALSVASLKDGGSGAKKFIPRRPSVGTSALYSALTGKDGDDYSHISSDTMKQSNGLKAIAAGPETIRMQVVKTAKQGSSSGNGRTNLDSPSIVSVGSESNNSGGVPMNRVLSTTGSSSSQKGTPEPLDEHLRSVFSSSPLKSITTKSGSTINPIVAAVLASAAPPLPLGQQQQPIVTPQIKNLTSSAQTPRKGSDSPTTSTTTPTIISTSNMNSQSSSKIATPNLISSPASFGSSMSPHKTKSSLSLSTTPYGVPMSQSWSSAVSGSSSNMPSANHDVPRQRAVHAVTSPRTSSRFGYSSSDLLQSGGISLSSPAAEWTTFSVYGKRFRIDFDKLLDVMLVTFGGVVVMVVLLDFWLLLKMVF